MAEVDFKGAAAYELEGVAANWADTTDTFGTRIEVHEVIVPQDIQDRITEPFVKQYANEAKAGVRGPWKQSTFKVKGSLHGHGTSPTGALTPTDLWTLLKNIIGGGSTDSVGGTVAASPTSASEFVVTGGTLESNGLIRVGSIKDGRGNGSFVAVDNISTSTLLTALDATPNESDVCYAAQLLYPLEGANMSTVASTRWLLQTASGQWKARGCMPVSLSISQVNAGEIPTWEAEFMPSRWEDGVNETFPSAVASDSKAGSICAAGSLFVNDVGTLTRATYDYRNWDLTIEMAVEPQTGHGGQDEYQIINGARRTAFKVGFNVQFDAEAAGTTTWATKYKAGTFQHALFTLSAVGGRAIGFYFPNCEIKSMPTQEASDGLNRVGVKFEAHTGPDTTSEETMACMKIGLG